MSAEQSTKQVWPAIEFEVDKSQEDLAAWLMMHCGSRGCEIRPAEGSLITVHATFNAGDISEAGLNQIKCALEEYGLSSVLHSLRVQAIEEQDWLAEWKKGFVPFAVGEKLLVCPPWLKDTLTAEQTRDREVLLVEPGMAFGTGLHATTQYCLRQIEQQSLGEEILDIGTGSGILAMAAAKLYPAARIIGVDTDAGAIKTAAENVELNGVADKVVLQVGSTEVFGNLCCDSILANLTCEDNIALLLEYLRLLRVGGVVICAGILKEKLPRLEKSIETYPLSIIHQEISEMWAGVTLQRIPVTVKM
jgi:ribosomal protein L11 methyltransferase